MATARLPNPTSGAETHLKAHHITLRESLAHQKDTNTFQKNTDINTFQSRIEAEGGFRKLDKTLNDKVAGGSSLAQLSEDVKDGTAKAEEKKTLGKGGEGPRALQALIKPFRKLISTQGGDLFGNFGMGMERGMERFNSGLKELTNGVGAFGPVINAFKTGMYKVIAVVNLLIGGFTIFLSLIGKVFGLIGQLFMGRPDKKLDEEKEKELDDNIAKAQEESDKLDKENPFPDVIWARLHPDTMSDIKSIVKNKGNDNSGDKTGKAFKDDVSKAKEDLKQRKKAAKENLKTAKDAKKNELAELAKENAKRFSGLLSQDKQAAIRKKMLFLTEKKNAFKKFLFSKDLSKKEKTLQAKKFVFEKAKYGKQKVFEKGLLLKKFAFEKMMMLKNALLRGLIMMAPFLAVGAALALTWKAIEDGAVAALARAGTLMTEKVSSIFKSLRASLGRLFPKLVGPPKVSGPDKKPDVDKKPDADKKPKPKARKFLGKLFKKIPVIGAGIETGMDMNEQNNKMNLIKDAYESGANVVQGEDGNMRPMTPGEYEDAVKANRANMTGSVGKGAGGFGGALAGGATGAAIGSVIPVVGTLIGGVIGSLIGGMFGSRAGDAAATNVAADMQGIEDPQTMIDNLALNAEAAMSGQNMQDANTTIADATSQNQGGGTTTIVQNSQSTNNNAESHTSFLENGRDRELEYATGIT